MQYAYELRSTKKKFYFELSRARVQPYMRINRIMRRKNRYREYKKQNQTDFGSKRNWAERRTHTRARVPAIENIESRINL